MTSSSLESIQGKLREVARSALALDNKAKETTKDGSPLRQFANDACRFVYAVVTVAKVHQDARCTVPGYIFGFLEEISKTINIAKLFASRHVFSRWLLCWQNKSTIATYTAQLQNALNRHGGPRNNMANAINDIVDDDGAIRDALGEYLSPAGIAPSSPAAPVPSADFIGNGSMSIRHLDGDWIVNNCTINRRTENSGNITNIRVANSNNTWSRPGDRQRRYRAQGGGGGSRA
ncbi:hypothetical protein PTI98_010592 [Pleurotus ostreatus]|nr:hypothetical protein PTI98_010592 [Pleurotus ostreatus]